MVTVGLGEGRCVVAQILTLIRTFRLNDLTLRLVSDSKASSDNPKELFIISSRK